jgi:hypothetical protein
MASLDRAFRVFNVINLIHDFGPEDSGTTRARDIMITRAAWTRDEKAEYYGHCHAVAGLERRTLCLPVCWPANSTDWSSGLAGPLVARLHAPHLAGSQEQLYSPQAGKMVPRNGYSGEDRPSVLYMKNDGGEATDMTQRNVSLVKR